MKQLAILTVVGLAFLFLLPGCQKEFSIENGNTPGTPGNNDPVYLDRVIETYSTLADSTVEDFRYDVQKRVSGINKKHYSNHILEDTSVTTYFYNGNDTVPFKYTIYLANVNVAFLDSSVGFMYYNALGKIISDSTIYSSGGGGGYYRSKEIGTYQYDGNNIAWYRTQTDLLNPASPVTNYIDSLWFNANKNMVKWHSYDSPPLFLHNTENNTFDNMLNPYYYTNIPYYRGVNNLLTSRAEKIFPGATFTYNMNYVHTYNSFNMPTQTTGTEAGSTHVEKAYYRYRSL